MHPSSYRANVNGFNKDGQTVLHLAATRGDDKMLSFLLSREDLDEVDPKDLKGRRTPLYLSAKGRHAASCEVLLAHGADTRAQCFGKTVAKHLEKEMPYFDATKVRPADLPAAVVARRKKFDAGARLGEIMDLAERNAVKGLSNSLNLREFQIYLGMVPAEVLDRVDSAGMGLFQKGCKSGLSGHVREMLDAGMDPNAVVGECSTRPVLLAAFQGFHETLDVLMEHNRERKGNMANFGALERDGGESVLSWVLSKPNSQSRDYRVDYEQSLKVVLQWEEVGRIVNLRDAQGSTPLHFAAQLWDQATVRTLLEKGANVGIKNMWQEVPVTLISPETMEAFLDDFCLTSKYEVTNNDLEITYNYSFLAPPIEQANAADSESLKEPAKVPALPETESLWYLSQSKAHRHLLKHPVIGSFLWLKWHKIEGFINRNLRLYLLFIIILSWYVFERFGGFRYRATSSSEDDSFCSPLSGRNESSLGFWFWVFLAHVGLQALLLVRDWKRGCHHTCSASRGINVCLCAIFELFVILMIAFVLTKRAAGLWTALTVLLSILIVRELLQMTGSLKRYLCSPENWLEMAMIALVGTVLWWPDSALGWSEDCVVKRHLSAVSIMLAWAEFVTLVARHPRLTRYNVYVTMFYRVLKTFFAFLLWYSFFIISFGLGFYIMLHRDFPPHDPDKDDYRFFNYPWVTLVKTSTMFVGELEFGDLPIDLDGPMVAVAHIFLLAFVFLIVVVLMNLLNGLAVSDTGMIRERAEIVSAVSRVETISYVESLLLGDPFDFLSNWPPFSLIKALPSLACSRCLYRSSAVKDLSLCVTGATGILLFYSTLPDKTHTVRPNKTGSCLEATIMDEQVVASSKAIIVRKEQERRKQQDSGGKGVEDLYQQVKALEDKIDKLMKSFKIE